jgi:hypothetical protein
MARPKTPVRLAACAGVSELRAQAIAGHWSQRKWRQELKELRQRLRSQARCAWHRGAVEGLNGRSLRAAKQWDFRQKELFGHE